MSLATHLTQRCKRSVLLLAAMLFVLAPSVFAPSAFAGTFSMTPDGPVYFFANNGSVAYRQFTITNTSNDTETVQLSVVGSSHFSVGNYTSVFLYRDSSRTIYVSYHAAAQDTSWGYLAAVCGVNSDSAIMRGIDTARYRAFIPQVQGELHFGSYYATSDTGKIRVENKTSSSMTITAFLSNTTDIQLLDSAKTVRPDSATYNGEFFRFRLTADSGSGWVVFTNGTTYDTVRLYAKRATTLPPQNAFQMPSYIQFKDVTPGDTVCQAVTFRNHDSTRSATITSLYVVGGLFYLSSSVPITIAPLDSGTLDICYRAPSGLSMATQGAATATYHWEGDTLGRTVYASVYGNTTTCISFSDSRITFEPVIHGGSVEASTTLRNNSGSTQTITAVHIYGQAAARYSATNTFPHNLASGAAMQLDLKFDASGQLDSSYNASLIVSTDDSSCTSGNYLALSASIAQMTGDSSLTEIFPKQSQTLALTAQQNTVTKKFKFVNNLGTSIKIVSVALDSGTHFSIVSIEPQSPQFDLTSNGVMTVTVQFDADSNGFFSDKLRIVTDNALTSHVFSLQAIETNYQSQPSAVAPMVQPSLSISIAPNPAHGPIAVNVAGSHNTRVEILNVLGATISTSIENSLSWKAIAPGSYFVRISGIEDNTGRIFTETRRVVVQ